MVKVNFRILLTKYDVIAYFDRYLYFCFYNYFYINIRWLRHRL